MKEVQFYVRIVLLDKLVELADDEVVVGAVPFQPTPEFVTVVVQKGTLDNNL